MILCVIDKLDRLNDGLCDLIDRFDKFELIDKALTIGAACIAIPFDITWEANPETGDYEANWAMISFYAQR